MGRGGFGAVYRAWDMNLSRLCAVKENLATTPEAQRQFMREATLLANLSHSESAAGDRPFYHPWRGTIPGDGFYRRGGPGLHPDHEGNHTGGPGHRLGYAGVRRIGILARANTAGLTPGYQTGEYPHHTQGTGGAGGFWTGKSIRPAFEDHDWGAGDYARLCAARAVRPGKNG